ncbi:helix-turn-helix domain-containing protein [Streptomyces anulatus]|uniref:helix-turn-helix domain-containing protein n=1 Tax=Streptomyces anulatus TaxID=1892 RepID=UPI001C25D60B|nr:helix-turn-helix domain-containing protein [Streptomyces anulatus]
MELDHPVALVIGAILHDRREAARVTTEEAARRLRIPTDQLDQIEAGQRPISVSDVQRLCGMYGVCDEAAALTGMGKVAWYPSMRRPGPGDDPFAAPRYDRATGSTERFITVMRQTERVRWLAPSDIPPPLRTPALAAATELPGTAQVTWPAPRPQDVFILDEQTLTCTRHGEAITGQIRHLLDLRQGGAQIHVLPLPPLAGEVIELTLPGGTVVARSHFHPDYQATDTLAATIDNALAGTVSGPDPLEQALAQHTAGERSAR